jgi:hypothetical protein
VPPLGDGGVVPPAPDASPDAADAEAGQDATTDAEADAGDAQTDGGIGAPGQVLCPPPSAGLCPVGGECCDQVNSSTGQCETSVATTCPSMFTAIRCDGPEDCVGNGGCCRIAGGGSTCMGTCAATYLCHVDADCTTGKCSQKAYANFYGLCQ